MCSHTYNVLGKKVECEWLSFYKDIVIDEVFDLKFIDLPLDTFGKCIYHSTELTWKRKNHFFERLSELLIVLDTHKSQENIHFKDFHFVGLETNEIQLEIQSLETFSSEIENIDHRYLLEFARKIVKKEVLIYDCVFHDAINLERCFFKGGFLLENCVFKKDVIAIGNVFKDDLTILDNASFYKNLSFSNYNVVCGKTEITNCRFQGRFDFDNVEFVGSVYIENNNFESKVEYVNFSGVFHSGLSFRKNETCALLSLDDCTFFKDSLFYNNKQHSAFHIENILIEGNIAFTGTEENLLFNTHTIFDLGTDSFGIIGHITFEYCDILQLGSSFLSNASELENQKLIKINPTCRLERLTVVYEYAYSKLKSAILSDFINIISRYFDYHYSINLNVDIQKDKKKNIARIVFKTTDDISDEDFKDKLRLFPSVNSEKQNKTAEEEDLEYCLVSMVTRLIRHMEKTSLDVSELKDIASLNENRKLKSKPYILPSIVFC